MENNTFYTKRNLVLFSLFAFAAMGLSLLYLSNFIQNQNTNPEDTAAAIITPTYIRLNLSSDKKTIYARTCPAPNKTPDFTCTAYKTFTVKSMGLPGSADEIRSISLHTIGKTTAEDTIVVRVLSKDGTKIYEQQCPIQGSVVRACGSWSLYKNVSELNLPDGVTKLGSFESFDFVLANAERVALIALTDASVTNQKIYTSSCTLLNGTEPNCPAISSKWNIKISNSGSYDYPDLITRIGGFSYHSQRSGSAGLDIREILVTAAQTKTIGRQCVMTGSPLSTCGSFDAPQNVTLPIGAVQKITDLAVVISNASSLPYMNNAVPTPFPTPVTGTLTPSSTPKPTGGATVTPTNNNAPTPQQPTGMYSTEIYLSEISGKQYIFERNCETNNNVTGETITSKCGTGWKTYPVSELAGSDTFFASVLQEAGSVDSLNMFMYPQGDVQYVRQTVVINGKDIYQRDCKVKSNKAACINETWVKQSPAGGPELGLPTDAFSKPNDPTISGLDMSILNLDYNDSSQNQLRQVVLSDDGKTQWTRTCTFKPASAPTNCNNWNPSVISQQNTGVTGLDALEGVDHHIQVYNNVIQIRQSWLQENGSAYVTRLCPRNNSGTFDCNLSTADKTQNKWSEVKVSSLGLPGNAKNVSWMDQFISYSRELDMKSIELSDNIQCTSKTVTAIDEGFYTGGRVDYTVNLKSPAPGPKGTVVVRDVINSRLDTTQKIPTYCQIKTGTVNSAVLGVSDTVVENGSVYISLVVLSVVGGLATYFIVVHNKERISSELFRNKPYLAGLLGTTLILVVGGSVMLLIRDNYAPSDTPAATQTYLECKLPEGTQSFTYRTRIKTNALPGEVISNTAELFTGSNTDVETCSVDFTVLGNGVTVTPTDTLTPTDEPTVTPSVTVTPTDVPDASVTPTPTTEPTLTATPTASVTPTTPLEGVACGAADVNGDGRFTILDFGGYQVGFASYYLSKCADRFEDYGVCGGKDANQDGVVNIIDLGSQNYGFAPRYGRETCDLDQLQ